MFSNMAHVRHLEFSNLKFGQIILAYRINGRAYATVLCPSVCRL